MVTGKSKSSTFSTKVGQGPSADKQQHWSVVVSLTLGDDAGTLHFCSYEGCDSRLYLLLITFVFLPYESFYIGWIRLLFSLLCPKTSSSQLSKLHSFSKWPFVFRCWRPLASSCALCFQGLWYHLVLVLSGSLLWGVENMSSVLLKC